jgi:hypothetical protein
MASRKRKDIHIESRFGSMAGLKDAIEQYREQLIEEDWPEGDDLPDAPVIGVVAKGLAELLDQMIRARGYDDEWVVASEPRYLGYGHYLSFRAEKIDAEYFFGFHLRSGFFLGTTLRYPEYLEAMPDSYWGRISGLSELGTTSYGPLLQLAALAGEEARGTRTANSVVLRIIRDAALADAKSKKRGLPGPETLDVWLPLTMDAVTLIRQGAEILRALYEVNYELYRVASQRARSGRHKG